MHEPLLSEIVQIRSNRLRSVRLEDDLSTGSLLSGYTLTAQALMTLERITEGVTNHTRAWTLTGPYGSGKSFFGLFLANLFDNQHPDHATAWNMVTMADPTLAERLLQIIGERGGFQTVAITGARVSLQECFTRGFLQVLETKDFNPALKKDLEQVRWADSRAFIKWLNSFIEATTQSRLGMNGVLLLFDEMGKALEHTASHPQESDVFLLQELAELAGRSTEHPFVFIGILHQSFEGYAAMLDRAIQREWTKVQGRFEDIPFQEPPIQQMRLLAGAFTGEASKLLVQIESTSPSASESLAPNTAIQVWCPATMRQAEFQDLCRQVYPIHPSVFVSLPYIFRRLAQNERSIFAYLSSQEPFGFQEFLSTHRLGQELCLTHLFDYLVANYQSRIYSSSRARPLTETLERLESHPSLKPIERDLLKTIGMLNWLGEISPLQAKEALILSALDSIYQQDELRTFLKSLQRRSLIIYRRFNDTYAVWQGSDVDIEERLQAAHSALETIISVAEVLQSYLPPRPLVARRHSYQTGTLRYFDVRYVDGLNRETILLTPSKGASGMVLLCLPTTLPEVDGFENWAQSDALASHQNVVIGVARRAIQFKELVQELRCLYWVRENTPELRDDPVARREWRTRLAEIEQATRAELDEAFNLQQPTALQGCQWFQCGRDVSSKVRRGLSGLLSEICDALYPASPRLWNELLNRRELTSHGAAARRNLIEGILTRAHEPLLGIKGFPPERSMYEALLRQNGMHRLTTDGWKIAPPEENHLKPAWQAIHGFVFAEPPTPRPIIDLYNRLISPPFGLTQGVIPVLLAIFYKVHENEITLYKEGTLLVEPDVSDWEVLLRRPELFAMAGCRVTGLRAAVVERLARGLKVPPFVMPIVRALVVRLKSLPEYAWRTQRLPQTAIAMRRAIELARSPEQFLFVDLPQALGLPPFTNGDFDPLQYEAFFNALNTAIDALVNATPSLLEWACNTWLESCGFPGGESGWERFVHQAKLLTKRVTHPLLIPILKRATEAPSHLAAQESVLAQIANRPLRTWTDADTDRFQSQAQYLGTLLQREISEDQMVEIIDPELHQRSEVLAQQISEYVQSLTDDPVVIRNAIKILLKRSLDDGR